jgi:hypothetical protein
LLAQCRKRCLLFLNVLAHTRGNLYEPRVLV